MGAGYATVYRPEYYQGLFRHHDDVLQKASKALEKQEEHANVIKRAVRSQEVFNYQLRDATVGLFDTYEALKKKNADYLRYVSLLERQQKLLTRRLKEATERKVDREHKTTNEIVNASHKRDEVVESLREFRERFASLEKKMSEYKDIRTELKKDIALKGDKAEKLLQKDKSIADHNKQLRQVLKLEQEAVQMVEMAEHRRLDQLSLLDPVYADYLKKRWAIDSGRTLYDWELSRFDGLVPPLVDPSLSQNETKRHKMDRIKIMDMPKEQISARSSTQSSQGDTRSLKSKPLQTKPN